MFIGAAVGQAPRSHGEAELFYRGYGDVAVNPVLIAYYRLDRIVQDIAAYWDQIAMTTAPTADRELALSRLMPQFAPGNVLDVATRSYERALTA